MLCPPGRDVSSSLIVIDLLLNSWGREYMNYIFTGSVARGLKLLPISKDFSPSTEKKKKPSDLTAF